MAQIPSSNISLQAIQAEVGHGTTSNISLKDQGDNSNNQAHTSTISGYGTTDLDASPYGMGEFAGYLDLSVGSFPALGSGYTTSAMTGSTVSTNFNMRRSHFSQQTGIQCGAFGVVGFRHTPSNGYVTIQFYSGTNTAYAPVYYQKLTYTGLANATWSVKYEYPNRSTAIDTFERYSSETTYDEARHPDTNGGGSYSEGTYYQLSASGSGNQYFTQFPWIAIAEHRSSPMSDNAQARVGDSVSLGFTNDVQFTLKATQGGTDYTASSTEFAIELTAQRGAYIP